MCWEKTGKPTFFQGLPSQTRMKMVMRRMMLRRKRVMTRRIIVTIMMSLMRRMLMMIMMRRIRTNLCYTVSRVDAIHGGRSLKVVKLS